MIDLDDLYEAYRIAGYEDGRYQAYGRRSGARAPWWLFLLAGAVIVLVVLSRTPAQVTTASNPFQPAPTAAQPTGGTFRPADDRDRWCADLLAALGNSAPSAETGAYCVAWTLAEDSLASGALAGNNPLNTSQDMPGATVFNSHGVKRYQTREQGIEATVTTLGYDYPGYSDIREGLKGNDPDRALSGLYASPWGTNADHVAQIWREILPKYTTM